MCFRSHTLQGGCLIQKQFDEMRVGGNCLSSQRKDQVSARTVLWPRLPKVTLLGSKNAVFWPETNLLRSASK